MVIALQRLVRRGSDRAASSRAAQACLRCGEEGRLESVLDKHETPESLAAVRQLDLQWVNTDDVFPDSELVLRLVVTDAGMPASGVKLVSRVNLPEQKASFSDATTDAQGAAEMKFALDESALSEASILVQASLAGRTATRKFPSVRAPTRERVHRPMQLTINGEARSFETPLTIAGLLDQLGLKQDRVAVEYNRTLLQRTEWASTILAEAIAWRSCSS